jgi:3-oxoacyl-[acyl-carrier protein] reductase
VGGHSAFAPFIPADETSNETIDLVLDLNLRYILFLIRDVLRHMKDSGRGGAIVSIGSVSGVSGSPNHSAYGAAKAGVNQLAKSVSAEYGRFGIRMNVVNPGVIVTDISAPQLADETRSHLSEVIPAQRLGRPADIANAVAFLCSPLSEYVAGQAILVDGGLSSRWPVPFQSKHPSEA